MATGGFRNSWRVDRFVRFLSGMDPLSPLRRGDGAPGRRVVFSEMPVFVITAGFRWASVPLVARRRSLSVNLLAR